MKNKLAKPNFKCLAYYTKILQLEKKEKKSYNFNSIFKSLITQWLTHSSIYNKNIYDSNFHTPITKLWKKKLSIKNVVTHRILRVEFFRHSSMKFMYRLRGLLPQSFLGANLP